MACVLGTGTTFTMTGDPTEVGRIVAIGDYTESIARIDNDDLETAGHMQYCPGDKIDHSEIEIPVVFEGAALLPLGTQVTGTIKFTDDSTLAGTGFLMQRGIGAIANNERIEVPYVWTFDGETGPVYVPYTPPPEG